MRINVTLSTDGACSGNPGPGGYAAILTYGEREKIVKGSEASTTNNKMELRAVIEGVRALKKPCCVTVETDSKYVITGLANGPEWAKHGWKLKSGGAPKNVEMWKELAELTSKGNHTIRFQYIEGHSGNRNNERCDKIAKTQIQLLKGDFRNVREDLDDKEEIERARAILHSVQPWCQQVWQGDSSGIIRAVSH